MLETPKAQFSNVKIIATLGPSSSSYDCIFNLASAGVSLFRLNFSHGDLVQHQENIQSIRKVEEQLSRPLGILLDLQGPKLRLGQFADVSVTLEKGRRFVLDLNDEPGNVERVNFPHGTVYKCLDIGHEILLDDGKIKLTITDVSSDRISTLVVVGGELTSKKGVSLPGIEIPVSSLTDKDKEHIQFGLKHDVDFLCLSFVQRPQDIKDARDLVGDKLSIIAKIEKPMAVKCFEEISNLADAIMIARGDLGVEMPPEDVPSLQKKFIRSCRQKGKPVVVATQMLDSMVNNPSPTRAEASDVATAVYDGADAVMLSAETAVGKYALETVEIMKRIILRVEADILYRQILEAVEIEPEATISDAISNATREVAETINAVAIVTYSASGYTTLRASRTRPMVPIIGVSPNKKIVRRSILAWGVHGLLSDKSLDKEEFFVESTKLVTEYGLAKKNDRIVVTAGVPFGQTGSTNTLRVLTV